MSSSLSPLTVPTRPTNNGYQMPVVGLGTWRAAPGEVATAVYEAIKIGYRQLDCARLYGNEKEVGEGIAKAIKEGIVKREELFITTKVWNNAHNRELATLSLNGSLSDLGVDYVDLLLIHWPVHFIWTEDGNMFPRDAEGKVINETDESKASIKLCWQAFEEFVEAGKVKSIGVSNFTKAEIDELLTYAKIKPIAHQIELHPYLPQDDMIQYCKEKEIIVQQYCPLANRVNDAQTKSALEEPAILDIAKKHNKTPAQIIIRWGVQHGSVPLPKSTKPHRLHENLNVFDFELDEEDMQKMAEIGKQNLRLINPAVATRDGKNGQKVFLD